MNAIEFRMLEAGDHALLMNAVTDVFDNDIDARLAAEFLADDRHHLAAAIDNGRVVGFASGVHYVHPDKPAEMWINEVGVADAYQGRGIGKAVMKTLLEHARKLACANAWVITERSNTAAMALYASTGGRESAPDEVMLTFHLDASA
ncbi:MAG TPA: GNAT family N-acetyltransferase [Vicinamibacterales bacterium]|nr:GNAT family N-acetyltransferase [Vicinamibacterales bacterium]